MVRALWLKLGAFVMLLALSASAADVRQPRSDTRRKTVNGFLTAWLVRKDIASALKFFHEKALTDGYVLACGCCGEVSLAKAERENPEIIERRLRGFLEEYSDPIKGRTLSEILFLRSRETPKNSDKMLAKIRKYVFNQPRRDKYYLVDSRFMNPDDEAFKHLGARYNLHGAFFSIIQYRALNYDPGYGDDLIVSLLWVKGKGQWQIANLGVACY